MKTTFLLFLAATTICAAEVTMFAPNSNEFFREYYKTHDARDNLIEPNGGSTKKVAPIEKMFIGDEIHKQEWQNIFGQKINGALTFVDSSIVGIRVNLTEYVYDRAKLCESDQLIIERFYNAYQKEKLERFNYLQLPVGEYSSAEHYFDKAKQLVAAQQSDIIPSYLAECLAENKKACVENDELNRGKPLVREALAKKLFNDERILRGFILDQVQKFNATRVEIK